MKTKNIPYQTNGFTLLETLIALVITTVVLGAAFMFYDSQKRSLTMQDEIVRAQQTLRVVNTILKTEIEMAGFDPNQNLNPAPAITAINNNASITYTRDGTGIVSTGALNNFIFSLIPIPLSMSGTNQLVRSVNGGAVLPISDDIEAISFAYAIDADGNGETDRYRDVGGVEHIIWTVDVNGDNLLDVNLDTNNDGAINIFDFAAIPPNLPNGIIPGQAIRVFLPGSNTVFANVPMTAIRAVRVWTLAITGKGDDKYSNTTTYIVGNQVITPATDANLLNNTFYMSVADTTIISENLIPREK